MRRIHILVSGKVQGVFFRAFAKDEADKLALKGFARNLDDGLVEVVAEGTEEKLKELLEILKTKHPVAKVTDVQIEWGEATNEYRDFRIVK